MSREGGRQSMSDTANYDPMRLCRQFLLTQHPLRPFSGWNTVGTQRWFIHHHADLAVTHRHHKGASVSLIGYAVDPDDPEMTDAEIVERIAELANSVDQILDHAGRLGGRWILLIERNDFDILLHDTCGLRQIFYSDHTHSIKFCASQASTAAKIYQLDEDPDAIEEFLKPRSRQIGR